MSLRALVTRPEEDARAIAAELRAQGIETILAPMLSIVQRRDPKIDLSGIQALLFTSANGVRAFAAASGARDLPVFAVGDATAGAARNAGFKNVEIDLAGAKQEAVHLGFVQRIDLIDHCFECSVGKRLNGRNR